MTCKLYLAQATFHHQWEPESAFLYTLEGPKGFQAVTAGSDPAKPVRTREASPLYAGFLAAAERIPHSSRVVVITGDQHLYGTSTRPGIFNTKPAEREARGYMRANPKDGPLENVEQLRRIDAVLVEKGIETSARRPDGQAEELSFNRVRWGVKELLRVDPLEAPGDWVR
ncbi:hypothetical protein [Aureimonas sp. AU40]|uniref:hypothetical protein n=1 Tax=Aureimonas sp. AU40 TaxID=1637747 RepID=UPI0007856DE7|nr:hypothetical protein [Aureimonas sp. AU40]